MEFEFGFAGKDGKIFEGIVGKQITISRPDLLLVMKRLFTKFELPDSLANEILAFFF